MTHRTLVFVALAFAASLLVIHKVRVFLAQSAPLGYEDDAGFHFGVQGLGEK